MKSIFAVCLLSLFAMTCGAQEATDRLIVPGARFGPITATTTEAMLQTLFGADKVESGEVNIGEGFMEPGAVVYPEVPTRRVEIIWQDATRTRPKEVRISGDASEWKTAEGISLGTTLKEIERLNGYPFRLAGFGWDYGGTIIDCNGGRFKVMGCMDGAGRVQGRQLLLRLNPTSDKAAMPEQGQVRGEGPFSSGHPAMQSLDPQVYQLIMLFTQAF